MRHEETDRYRWRRPDGSRLVLTTRGRLLESGPVGAYRLIEERCDYETAAALAARSGYRQAGAAAAAGTARAPILPPREARPRPRARREDLSPRPGMLRGEALAAREARIEAHAARVAAELARLGLAGVDTRRGGKP